MRPTRKAGPLSIVAVSLAVVVVWTALGAAQGQRGAGGRGAAAQAPPVRIQVQETQVKPEMVGVYQDLIKNELIPGLKKAGVQFRWTYTTGPSGQAFTFTSVQPITNYAQFDQPGALQKAIGTDGVANYNAKIRPTIVSQHNFIQTLRQDLSIQSNSPTPPALLVVQAFQVAPGKGNDFTSSMTSDYLPNFKKAGVKDFWAYGTNFGAPGGQIVTVRALAKYAELDEPGLLNKAGLSQEAIQQMGARRAAVASVIGNDLIRLVPELSFGSPSAGPAAR